MHTDHRWMKLSYNLSEDSPLPPGIPAMIRRDRASMAKGDVSNVVDLTICNHIGSHMDAPLHFAAHGPSLSDFDVNEFYFTKPLVLDIPLVEGELICPEHFAPFTEQISQADIQLIRTGFGKHRATDPERYRLKGPGFSEAGAQHLADNFPDLRCLGTDTVSLASMMELDEGLRAHQALLVDGKKFLVLEDLDLDYDLSDITEVIALPLMVRGIDGGPCTVIAR